MVASIFPTLAIVLVAVRSRRVDALGALSLAAIAVAVAAGLAFDSSRILLDKESVVTGLLGLASLGSLLTSRPLILVLASRFNPRLRGDVSDLLQRSAGFRERSRRLTLIWGAALLADATMRVVLSFLVTPAELLVLSLLLSTAALGPLALWTIRNLRRRTRLPVRISRSPALNPTLRDGSAGRATAARPVPGRARPPGARCPVGRARGSRRCAGRLDS